MNNLVKKCIPVSESFVEVNVRKDKHDDVELIFSGIIDGALSWISKAYLTEDNKIYLIGSMFPDMGENSQRSFCISLEDQRKKMLSHTYANNAEKIRHKIILDNIEVKLMK